MSKTLTREREGRHPVAMVGITQYWVQLGPGNPERLTAPEVAAYYASGAVSRATPVCIVGAPQWSTIEHLPELVAAISALHAPVPKGPANGAPRSPAAPVYPAGLAPTPAITYAPQLEAELAAKKAEIQECVRTLEALKQEITSVEEAIEIQSFGFYRPRYGFESSEAYAARLAEVRREQEALLKSDQATVCEKKWVVDGSTKKGAAMLRDQSKLMLRAFNGACFAAS